MASSYNKVRVKGREVAIIVTVLEMLGTVYKGEADCPEKEKGCTEQFRRVEGSKDGAIGKIKSDIEGHLNSKHGG